MGVKDLGIDEIKRRAEKFREIMKNFSSSQQAFDLRPEVKEFLSKNPLAPIIATICDEQITSEHAWTFPYWLSKQCNDKDFSAELILGLEKTE